MNKIGRKISIFLISIIVFCILGCLSFNVFASDNFDIDSFNHTNVPGSNTFSNLVNNSAITAITVARIVCVAIAIVMLLVIAMKYMISAPGDRADIKKHAINYVIGAFILFGVTGILSILNNISKALDK